MPKSADCQERLRRSFTKDFLEEFKRCKTEEESAGVEEWPNHSGKEL